MYAFRIYMYACVQEAMIFNVSDVAFFLLATVSLNGFNFRGQRYTTYYESRILPIRETWGSFFPSFYFVFGNSIHDHRYLLKRCKLVSTQGDPYVRQRSSRNSTDLYDCHVLKQEWTWNHTKRIEMPNPSPAIQIFNDYQQRRMQPFKALYTTNCSGTYFGIGPTCRCQEAMRFFIQNPLFSHVKWFAFMDDDLYYRPYSLLALLRKVDSRLHSRPVTLVSGIGLRGFTQFKNKLNANGIHNCTNERIHRFMYAQPAFLNRKAMEELTPAIHHNALTGLHRYWGGSHDSLLGLLLWMHEIPVYGMNSFYCGMVVYVSQWRSKEGKQTLQHDFSQSHCSIYHRVMSRIIFKKIQNGTFLPQYEIASQYDIARFVRDAAMYNNQELSEASLLRIVQDQVRLGDQSAARLEFYDQNTMNQTAFVKKRLRWKDSYAVFTPDDCTILPAK